MKIFTVFLEHSNIFFKHTRNFYHEMFFDENLSKFFFIFPIFLVHFMWIFKKLSWKNIPSFSPEFMGKLTNYPKREKFLFLFLKLLKYSFPFVVFKFQKPSLALWGFQFSTGWKGLIQSVKFGHAFLVGLKFPFCLKILHRFFQNLWTKNKTNFKKNSSFFLVHRQVQTNKNKKTNSINFLTTFWATMNLLAIRNM